MNRFLRQVVWLIYRRRREADLQAELAFHLSAEAEDRQADGLSQEEARFRARRDLGNVTLVQEDTRATWGWVALEHLMHDLRYGLRGLRKNPAFTGTAVLSLALGIGANTAIFSLIDALTLRWLPVRDPQALVQIRIAEDKQESFSYAIVRALAEQEDIFEGVAGFSGWAANVGTPGSTDRVPGALVTGGFYRTLGLNPAAGRLLADEDDRTGAPPVAVISYGYWERQFGRNPQAIGKAVRVNGAPVTIVGVSPPGFVGANVGSVADITMPVAALPAVSPEAAGLLGPGNFWLRVLARPRAGVSKAQARAQAAAVWPQIADRVTPAGWPGFLKEGLAKARFELVPGGTGWTRLRAVFRKPLFVLMGVVALVLVIAGANVANLLLARATVRQREIAVRLAIGGGRGRIIRQLLTESALLGACGAALGLVLAWGTGRLLLDVLSSGPQRVTFDMAPNWHVLAFTSAVAMVTALGFGLAPAFRSAAIGPSGMLKEHSGISRSRSLSSLVVVQVALSVVLVIGAGLFARTLDNLENVDPGFRREGVLLVDLEGRRTAFPRELLDELQQVPGIFQASVSTHTPLSGAVWSEPAVPRGQAVPERDNAYFIGAGPRFFDVVGMRLLAGRGFNDRDTIGSPPVAVVNEAYALRYFNGANPVGHYLSAKVRGHATDLEILGVVKNADLAGLRKAAPPAVYVPYYQLLGNNFPTTLAVRVSGSLSKAAAAVHDCLQPRLPNVPIEVRPLSAQVEATLVQERLLALLAAMFGGLALVLAIIGLYGLLAYGVARQSREIGLRMALGAQRRGVIAMVLRRAVGLVLLGTALGLPAALVASRWVKSMLFGLSPADPATMLQAAFLLIAAALAAAYVPARRAAAVDPMTALRHE